MVVALIRGFIFKCKFTFILFFLSISLCFCARKNQHICIDDMKKELVNLRWQIACSGKNLRRSKARLARILALEKVINENEKRHNTYLLLPLGKGYVGLTAVEYRRFLTTYSKIYPKHCRQIKRYKTRIIKLRINHKKLWEIVNIDIWGLDPAVFSNLYWRIGQREVVVEDVATQEVSDEEDEMPLMTRGGISGLDFDGESEEEGEVQIAGVEDSQFLDKAIQVKLMIDEMIQTDTEEPRFLDKAVQVTPMVDVAVQVNMQDIKDEMFWENEKRWWQRMGLLWASWFWAGIFDDPKTLEHAKQMDGSFWEKVKYIFNNS